MNDEIHDSNAYFAAFDGIISALDDLAKTLTPDTEDDAAASESETRPCCNSYFESFRNIHEALVRVKEATAERIAASAEVDPTFAEWRGGAYNINIGQSAKVTSNGVAIGWGSGAGAATSPNSKAKDSGAVALGKQAHAYGYEAVALGKNANVGADGNRVSDSTVQLGAGTNLNNGSLQFRSWPLVDATGKIENNRLPDTVRGLVEASSSFGTVANRTLGLWYAIFTPEGLGITDESVCLKSVTFTTHNNAALPSYRKVEIRSEDGTVLIATSENSSMFPTPGGAVKFTFGEEVMLKRGIRYRLKMADMDGANQSAPLMLAATSSAAGYLACYIDGSTSLRTDYFPCLAFTILKPQPDIAEVLADARDAVNTAGAFALATPAIVDYEATLADRTVNVLPMPAESVALRFPEKIDGYARSFIVRMAASESSDGLFSLPAGVSFESGDEDALADVPAGEVAILAFMEVAENVFMVSRRTVNTVTK